MCSVYKYKNMEIKKSPYVWNLKGINIRDVSTYGHQTPGNEYMRIMYSYEEQRRIEELQRKERYKQQQQAEFQQPLYSEKPIYIQLGEDAYKRFIATHKRYNFEITTKQTYSIVTVDLANTPTITHNSVQLFRQAIDDSRDYLPDSLKPYYIYDSSKQFLVIKVFNEWLRSELEWFMEMMNMNGFSLDMSMKVRENKSEYQVLDDDEEEIENDDSDNKNKYTTFIDSITAAALVTTAIILATIALLVIIF